jgi:hypothetical protein
LSPESLERILEHDRWKTELILDHELKIEELRSSLLKGGDTYVYTEEDKEFNSLTSGAECGDAQMFKLSKTKVKNGITSFCNALHSEFYSLLSSDSNWSSLSNDDKNKLKVKNLFTSIVYFVCCAERIRRWPHAKDKSSFSQVQKELESRCLTFESISLELIYENLVKFWPSMFGLNLEFNDKEIRPIIDDSVSKTTPLLPKDIKTSPLFKEAQAKFSRLDLNTLQKYCSILPFVEAGVKTLTLDFIQNRPAELDYTSEYAEWSDIYINHLHNYKENWKNELKEIERKTKQDQNQWEGKEST